jgi:hypothetical protein
VWYPDAILGIEQLERCLAVGAVSPIFDGLDELCTVFPWDFSPEDTVQELLSIFNDKNGPGRLLITSRSSFWTENITPNTQSQVLQIELCPFSDPQRTAYIEKRFVGDFKKRDRAFRILSRIGGSTATFATASETQAVALPDASHHPYHKIEYLPYVVMLSAESADTDSDDIVQRYGKYLSSDDPLRGLLLSLCDRERRRHNLEIPAESQVELFATLATEFGESFDIDELKLAVDAILGANQDVNQIKGHAFLDFRNERYHFVFPFLLDYLRASALRDWLKGDRPYKEVARLLATCTKQPGSLLDGAAQLILSTIKDDWIELARKRMAVGITDESLCGFFYLITVVAKNVSHGVRQEVTSILMSIFGDLSLREIADLYIEGSLANLDLRGISFRDCTFKDIELTKCTFDERSRFERCRFLGRLFDDRCDGFGAVEVIDCHLSGPARSAFQLGSVRGVSAKITKQQIKEGAYDLCRRFVRGSVGFVTRRRDSLEVAVRRLGSFGPELIGSLERYGVLEPFQAGTSKMFRVGDTRVVRLFVQNNLVTGKLQEALNAVASKFDAE